MIKPVRVPLPAGAEDFGRHRTGMDQSFKVKDYFYVPLLPQLERILNFIDVYDEIMRKKLIKKKEFAFQIIKVVRHFKQSPCFRLTALQYNFTCILTMPL